MYSTFKTVTTWFKNQRCRLPKMLRKQLLEVNAGNFKRSVSIGTSKNGMTSATLLGSYYANACDATNEVKTEPCTPPKVDEKRISFLLLLTFDHF